MLPTRSLSIILWTDSACERLYCITSLYYKEDIQCLLGAVMYFVCSYLAQRSPSCCNAVQPGILESLNME